MVSFFRDNETRKKKISESLKKHYESDKGLSHKLALSQKKKEYWKKLKGE
jgi:hypothetical protein